MPRMQLSEDSEWKAGEINSWMENDEYLYNIRRPNWVWNYKRKMDKGRYDHNLAVKGIAENFVPEILRHYRRNADSSMTLSHAEKYMAAEIIVRDIESDIREGNAGDPPDKVIERYQKMNYFPPRGE